MGPLSYPPRLMLYCLDYSWFNDLTDTPPQLPSASYRYNASSGAVIVVDDSIGQPNGIAFTPDGSTVYISDTAAVSAPVDPKYGHPGGKFNTTHRRQVFSSTRHRKIQSSNRTIIDRIGRSTPSTSVKMEQELPINARSIWLLASCPTG